jgi:hypothetical protein
MSIEYLDIFRDNTIQMKVLILLYRDLLQQLLPFHHKNLDPLIVGNSKVSKTARFLRP